MSTNDRLVTLYRQNAAALRAMAAKAGATGRRVNGYTAAELRERAEEYSRMAAAGRALGIGDRRVRG